MRRNKFRAKPTNGFASKLESRINDELIVALDGGNEPLRELLQVSIGDALSYQYPIKFACGAKHLCDFAIHSALTGQLVSLVEAKGKPLPVWALKMRLLKHEYPRLYEIYTVAWGNGYRHVSVGKKKRCAKKKR